jgi:uncharacterized protein (DUF433 family)
MTLLMELAPQPAPLRQDEHSVLRVGGTRVRLDTVIGAFHQGCSPKEIQRRYPSLNLTDIYGAITYYLWHQKEVDLYLEEQRRQAEDVRKWIQKANPPEEFRRLLMERQAKNAE